MSTAALALAGLALGAASAPHCAFMCGAPCAAITGGGRRRGAAFHLGRLVSYMAGGALAAASVSTLGAWARASAVLQPLWTLLQLAFLALGLWWLVAGRMPRRLLRDGAVPVRFMARGGGTTSRAGAAGLAWAGWPCGALHGALLLAALADGAAGGALVMSGFALASAPGLVATPWLWARLARVAGGGEDAAGQRAAPGLRAAAVAGRLTTAAYRAAGLALVLSSGWALARTVQERLLSGCFT